MPGRIDEVFTISAEVAAEHSAQAIYVAKDSESEDALDIIERNARHLQMVLPSLSISKTKREEYESLIADSL